MISFEYKEKICTFAYNAGHLFDFYVICASQSVGIDDAIAIKKNGRLCYYTYFNVNDTFGGTLANYLRTWFGSNLFKLFSYILECNMLIYKCTNYIISNINKFNMNDINRLPKDIRIIIINQL